MHKLPTDYSKTVIYRISCDELPDFIYIGSTTEFIKRKHKHKTACKNNELKLYKTIRENGGWDNWNMSIIEQYLDCKNKIEQKIREQEYIDKFKANLNMIKAYITEEQKKENYEKNKDKYYENKKEIYNNNKDKKNEKRKEYYYNNKDKINKQRKEWAEKNKEKIQKYKKECYEKDKNIF